jgi:hypothetical protein
MTTNGATRKRNAIGESFVPLKHSVLKSPRYRRLSINARRFLDFLMDEHLNHGGKHNGRLQATYRQLVGSGISYRLIAPAIREACDSGLVRITRPGGRNLPTHYELTWVPRHHSAIDQPQPKATAGEPA